MPSSVALVVRLKCFTAKEGELWIAGCPSLDVFSQGDSSDDAKASLREAVELWFESCIERGTLQQAMQELGFRPISASHVLAEDEELVAMVETPEEVLGQPFSVDIEIPAYQASLFMEQANRSFGVEDL